MKTNALLVARVSDESQRPALPAQKKKLFDYASIKKWVKDIDYKYVEFDETAYKPGRKTFKQLVIEPLENAKSPKIVVFDKIDRFSRDTTSEERVALTNLSKAGKIEIHFPSDNLFINANSPAADLFRLEIGISLAAYYSSSIRDNVKRRFEQLLNDGVWVHRAPIGYKNVNLGTDVKPIKEIVKDDDREHYVVKAFQLRASGVPYEEIAKMLLKDGYTSRKTGEAKLTRGGVEKIINNPFYYGVMVHNGVQYPHKYPPLIDRALFNQCKKMKDKRKSMKTKYNSLDFTLKGIVTCGLCGRRVSSYNSKDIVYLRCADNKCPNSTSTAESLVMGAIDSLMQNFTMPEHLLEKVVDELKGRHDDQQRYYEENIKTIRKEYDKNAETLKRNYRRMLEVDDSAGSITYKLFEETANELGARQEELNEQLKILTSGNTEFLVTTSYLLDLATRAEQLFKCSDEKLRAELLGFLLSNLKLNDKKLTFDVNYPFNLLFEQKEKSQLDVDSSLWCGLGDSNSWPLPWQGSALTTELNPLDLKDYR